MVSTVVRRSLSVVSLRVLVRCYSAWFSTVVRGVVRLSLSVEHSGLLPAWFLH